MLRLPDGADPLQTYENGSPLGDTRFLDFGAGINASLVGDDYVLVEGASGSRWGTVVVAASDTHAAGKESADFVCTGTADQTTLDLALDAAPEGGEIVLLEGTYQLTARWSIDEANIKVRGMGPATIIRITAGFANDEAFLVRANKVWIDSVAFLDATPRAKRAINFATTVFSATDCLVTRCFFTTWARGCGADGLGTAGAQRLRILDCYFDNCDDGISHMLTGGGIDAIIARNRVVDSRRYGINFAGDRCLVSGNHVVGSVNYGIYAQSTYYHISDNFIHSAHSTLLTNNYAIFASGHECSIVDNRIQQRTEGVVLGANDQICVGNDIKDCSGNAFWISSGQVTIVGNLVDQCLRGVLANRGDAVIANNTIKDCLQEGIRATDSSTRTDLTITGNFIMRCGQTANNTYDGIAIVANFDDCNIQGNTVRHEGAANQHRYGINIAAASCDNNLVCNNDLYNSGATGSFNDAGTATRACTGGGLSGGGSPATINGHVIEDEGTPLTQRANLNFVGAGVTVTDSAPDTIVTIPGGGGATSFASLAKYGTIG